MPKIIRGLTLRHPWAFCIARLGKDVENRTWEPPRSMRDQLIAIHGGAMPKGAMLDECKEHAQYVCERVLVEEYLKSLPSASKAWLKARGRDTLTLGDFITPGIVAVARLKEVRFDSPSPWAVRGAFHWCLTDIVTLPEAVSHKGAQGLWTVEPDALQKLRELYQAARAA